MNKPRDWRTDYVVCPHVEQDTPNHALRASGFRVCCAPCAAAGFLRIEDLENVTTDDGLCVARLKGGPR